MMRIHADTVPQHCGVHTRCPQVRIRNSCLTNYKKEQEISRNLCLLLPSPRSSLPLLLLLLLLLLLVLMLLVLLSKLGLRMGKLLFTSPTTTKWKNKKILKHMSKAVQRLKNLYRYTTKTTTSLRYFWNFLFFLASVADPRHFDKDLDLRIRASD
jgi:hypothetical protein